MMLLSGCSSQTCDHEHVINPVSQTVLYGFVQFIPEFFVTLWEPVRIHIEQCQIFEHLILLLIAEDLLQLGNEHV